MKRCVLRTAALSSAIVVVIHGCAPERAAPIAPPLSLEPAVATPLVIADSQPNYYAADVSMTITSSGLPHFTPTSPVTVFTYRITKSRSNSSQPWKTRLQFSGSITGAIETDDVGSYRRTYNSAGVQYTPALLTLGRMSAGIPTSQDPIPKWPSLPSGITPLSLATSGAISMSRDAYSATGGATRRAPARSPGGYIVSPEDGQLALAAMQRPGVSTIARRGDTVTFAARATDGSMEVSLSSSTGVELETVLRQLGMVAVRARHMYRELRPGVLARTGSVIDVTAPPAAKLRPAHIVYSLSNILYERREVP
jgi:hypothetical protein